MWWDPGTKGSKYGREAKRDSVIIMSQETYMIVVLYCSRLKSTLEKVRRANRDSFRRSN